MKIPLRFWRSRFSLDTPWGHHASYTPGNNGIESVEYDTETGLTTVLRKADGIVIGNDGFGYFEREQPKQKSAKEAANVSKQAPLAGKA